MSRTIERKKIMVERLVDLCKKNNSLIISRLEKISANKLKAIRKELKNVALLKVVKKSILKNVLKELRIEDSHFPKVLSKPCIIIITSENIFKIASLLEKNKYYDYLKPGEVLNKDIIIEKGTTNLPPTEIASISKTGLKVGVEKGKVVIKEKKILKKGDKITEEWAEVLKKLDIKPIKLGLNVDIGIDLKSKKIYKNIVIDKEKEKEMMYKAINNAYNLALNINYICKKTIESIIIKAITYAKQLNKFLEEKK